MKKISSSIVVAITGCVLVATIIVGSISTTLGRSNVRTEAIDKLNSMTMQYVNEMSISFFETEEIANGISNYVESTYDIMKLNDRDYNATYAKTISNYLKLLNQKNNTILETYYYANPRNLGSIYGAVYQGDKEKVIDPTKEYALYSKRDASWVFWYEAQKNGSASWLDPTKEEEYNTEVINYSLPVFIDKQLVACVGIKISFEDFSNTVNAIKPYDTGYSFLIDKYQRFLVHKKYTKEHETIQYMEEYVKRTHEQLMEMSDQYNIDASNMSNILEDISTVSSMMTNEINDLVQSFSNLTYAMNDGARGITNISTNTEEVSLHTKAVEEESSNLEKIASELEKAIELFTV